MSNTCVYIHTRTDGVVFYVGIGSPCRPYQDFHRNKHWHNTTEKYGYTVTVLHENLPWDVACAIEVQLIAKYRTLSGNKLCNITDGGDGLKNPFPETRAKMSTAARGRTHTVETRAKISEANRNRSPETLAKMSTASIGNSSALGTKWSDEARAKLRVPKSEEHRAKLSASLKGNTSRLGKTASEETRAKISAALKNPSLETRAKLSSARKNMSVETREKLSASLKGNTNRLGGKKYVTHVSDVSAMTPEQAKAKLSLHE